MILVIKILLLLTLFSKSQEDCNIKHGDPFTCSEILVALKFHNLKRNDVALGKTKLSGAKNMFQLKWDPELAEKAQAHAIQCEFKHNPELSDDIGENLAWLAVSKDIFDFKTEFSAFVDHWFDEIYNYDESGGEPNGTTDHFMQLVWANTKYVGCGIVYYEDKENLPDTPFCVMLVCNYKPAGNVAGQNMYIKDDGLDKCDNGLFAPKYGGLCAHDENHVKTGDSCTNDPPDSEGRILRESVIVIFINFAIAWYCMLRE